MRVLVTSVSALGHVHPMVPLVRALLDRGHLIRWVTGPDAATRLRRLGIAVDPAGPPFEDLRAEYRRRYPEFASLRSDQVPDHVFPHLFGEIVSAALFEEDLRIAREWRPDLVIHDAAEFAAPVAAAAVGVPSVTHAFGALTPVHRVSDAAELAAPLWRSMGLEPRPFGGLYDHLYLDIYPPSFEVEDMSHVPRRQPLRPIAFDDADDDPSGELTDAPGADPLVYITLGTVIRDRSSLRVALEAIANRRVRVLVTVGPAGDPAELGPQPDHVRVERYVPQTRVLPHCAAVISHAGSGTFLATLAQGVPQLCLPHAADQFMNAAACRRSGAGLVLQPDEVSVPAIDQALTRLLSEERFREQAGAVRAEIAAMPSPSEIVPMLEALANRS